MKSAVFVIALALCVNIYGQKDWPYVGGDADGTRFSRLRQIDRSNVASLQVAWTFHTGPHHLTTNSSPPAIQCTPLVIDGTMYLTSADTQVIALSDSEGDIYECLSARSGPESSELPNFIVRACHDRLSPDESTLYEQLRDAPLQPFVNRNQHGGQHPFDPVIAPHRATIDEIERQHGRTPQSY